MVVVLTGEFRLRMHLHYVKMLVQSGKIAWQRKEPHITILGKLFPDEALDVLFGTISSFIREL